MYVTVCLFVCSSVCASVSGTMYIVSVVCVCVSVCLCVCFRCHEWSKHGTCAAVMPALDSEYKFFSFVLNFRKQHDFARYAWFPLCVYAVFPAEICANRRICTPGGVMGPPKGVPRSGGSGGPPPGNFVNLDCKSLILGTSRGHRKYKQTELLYDFFGFLVKI